MTALRAVLIAVTSLGAATGLAALTGEYALRAIRRAACRIRYRAFRARPPCRMTGDTR